MLNAEVGEVLELHGNKDASETPTLSHTLAGQKTAATQMSL
jgi:hypothetical protein